jgi:flagellar operon protein
MSVNTIKNIAQKDTGSVHARNAIRAFRTAGVGFTRLMHKKVGELRFSAHAQTRMKSRNINLTKEIMSKLDKAVSGAEEKGSKDTLVLLSDLAFIVNIPNKTVVTAMEGKNIKDNVFTNIDSTVIAD